MEKRVRQFVETNIYYLPEFNYSKAKWLSKEKRHLVILVETGEILRMVERVGTSTDLVRIMFVTGETDYAQIDELKNVTPQHFEELKKMGKIRTEDLSTPAIEIKVESQRAMDSLDMLIQTAKRSNEY